MTNNENICAWFQNLHLPGESKTDLEKILRVLMKHVRLVTKIRCMHICIYVYLYVCVYTYDFSIVYKIFTIIHKYSS